MTIHFLCPRCLRKSDLSREETDPPNAASATLVCPDCDDGDFHSPEFFDIEGRHLDFESGKPFDGGEAVHSPADGESSREEPKDRLQAITASGEETDQ